MPRTRPRDPRYQRFIVTGAVVGLLVAVLVVVVRADAVERPDLLLFYLGMLFAGAGALLGGLVAVLFTGRSA